MTALWMRLAWAGVFLVLTALAVPWFLWGTDRLLWGLPLWLWWHIGWMVLASVVFKLFVDHAWGIWITGVEGR